MLGDPVDVGLEATRQAPDEGAKHGNRVGLWYMRGLIFSGVRRQMGSFRTGARRVRAGTLGWLCAATLALSAHAVAAADPNKVLRIAFNQSETGFDPARVSDSYSNVVNEAIFERLLSYDYLARPAKLVPEAAEAMPEITDSGRTYTFRIRKGIHFTPDPAFKGKRRELTADDFVYSFKRFVDPKLRSPWAFMLEGKVEGLDELVESAKRHGRFDYDARVAGLQALDRYTLRIRLKATDYVFLYTMAQGSFGAVAREVVEAYGEDVMSHPVGTGPYYLKEWRRANRIVLEANPDFRGYVWNFAMSEPADEPLVKAMRGKRMPQVGRVEISVIEEEQSRWLAFNQKELDYLQLPATFRPQVFDGDNKLKREWADRGVTLFRAVDPDIVYTVLNLRDPLIGGFSKEKIALRRAIIMGYKLDDEIRVIRKHQAVRALMPVPVGVVGHDPHWKPLNNYDPDLANKLLDHFGYRKGADGYRTLPDGKPLVLRFATETASIDRQFSELWRKSMDAIGIRSEFQAAKWADNNKAAKTCHLMLWQAAWLADYPDGENFMQLLYGPNTGQSNNGCYQSADYDGFYRKMLKLPDSPERTHLFREMTRQMEVDGAWSLQVSRERNQLIWPWAKGYKNHPILSTEFAYMDVEPRK